MYTNCQSADEKYMQLCLELAQKAFGNTYPNPMVGCVVVYNDEIIGQGYHHKAGEPHAEVNAINSVANKSLLAESTLYVNLEPCAHFGKTPPCCNLIVAHGLKRVVVGCVDSFEKVSGKGIEVMQNAGIKVDVGVLEKECIELNKRFFTFYSKKRPYVILKWAQTQDGFIDQAADLKRQTKGDRCKIAPFAKSNNFATVLKGLWITNDVCKTLVHQWRVQEQAIIVGTNTAEIDNPQLTARLAKGNNPLRIAIDINGRLPQNLFIKDGSTPSIIFTQKPQACKPNLEYVLVKDLDCLWSEIFAELHKRQVQSVIIEGGAMLLNSVISANLWDEARVFTGPGYFERGVQAPVLNIPANTSQMVGDSKLDWFFNG